MTNETKIMTYREIIKILEEENYKVDERYYENIGITHRTITVTPGPPGSVYTIRLGHVDVENEKYIVKIQFHLDDIEQIIYSSKLMNFCEQRKIPYGMDCSRKDIEKIKQFGRSFTEIASKLEEKLK